MCLYVASFADYERNPTNTSSLYRSKIIILLVCMHNYMRKNIREYAQGRNQALSTDVP